ncbi:High-affinity zinc uptake system binding-protein ZnuA [anaerobic digester metagenome]|nr:zinc ABC transporter substrate-binding protein [Methanobacterium aggregans]
MILKKKRIIGIFMLLGVIIFFLGTVVYEVSNDSKTVENSTVTVAVTIPTETEFVKKVGGDRVNVVVMVPPGADPHTYEPTPGKIQKAGQADMYAEVGSGIEFEIGWMDKIKGLNSEMLIVNCSKGLDLMESTDPDEGNNDPHVWNSPRNAKVMVENIYEGLVEVDPENRDYYTKNRDVYLQELDKLDENITETLADDKGMNIMVYHPSWGYFCRDYGLNQISIEKEGKEPTSKNIAELVTLAKKDNVTVIFVSPQFSNASASVIADQIGGHVVSIDTMPENYLDNMYRVSGIFAETVTDNKG